MIKLNVFNLENSEKWLWQQLYWYPLPNKQQSVYFTWIYCLQTSLNWKFLHTLDFSGFRKPFLIFFLKLSKISHDQSVIVRLCNSSSNFLSLSVCSLLWDVSDSAICIWRVLISWFNFAVQEKRRRTWRLRHMFLLWNASHSWVFGEVFPCIRYQFFHVGPHTFTRMLALLVLFDVFRPVTSCLAFEFSHVASSLVFCYLFDACNSLL